VRHPDIQPIDATLPRPAKVTVEFVELIDFSGRYDALPLGRARREVTDPDHDGDPAAQWPHTNGSTLNRLNNDGL
jgi:hypothetical protein